ALVEGRAPQHELVPGQGREPPIDDLERWPPSAVVEEEIRVERRDDLAVVGQDVERGGGGGARIDPAVEGGEQDRVDQLAAVYQLVQAHRGIIGDAPQRMP